MNVSLCAEESEFDRDGCTCAAECALRCSDIVSVTFVTIEEFSFNDSSALLLSIGLNGK